MDSKTTSKTSCLKALLLRAWRERWSDVQWGINIKTVLPRGVSGDVYNLADCILQQAVVGSGANQLVLSYLKHSLSARLVSHAAVLSRVAKFNQFQKYHCVSSLLDFLEGVLPGVTCCGKAEETNLASALLATTIWLLEVIHHNADLQVKTTKVLKTLLNDHFYLAMMCLSKYSEPEMHKDLVQQCKKLENNESITDLVKILQNLNAESFAPSSMHESGPGCLIQAWLSVQLIGNPGTTTAHLTQRLKLLQYLKHFSDARLASELIRGSLICLNDGSQTQHESQWGAFAFIKVPHVLAQLCNSDSLIAALELLLQHAPLLDAMDTQSSCSSLDCLLGELVKLRLINELQSQQLSGRRQPLTCPKLDTAAGIPKVIICAEQTLAGILKTLSTDYHKNQDALLGMLHQVLTGKSFELILAVATVQGQLKTFVQRLIRFNECSKQAGDKARAQLFDISFLMLVAIVQNYGADAVLHEEAESGVTGGAGDSLLERWVAACMVEAERPKAPEQLLRLADPPTVEQLLKQFNAGESEITPFSASGGNSSGTPTSTTTSGSSGSNSGSPIIKWGEVLFSMGAVMKEVLIAWELGVLAPADVKRILDAVRGKMCCLPVGAAAWLCAYMRTAPQDTLLKPVNMVQQLLAPQPAEEDSERWHLTCEIIRKMQRDIQLPLQPKTSGRHLVSKQPATEQLHAAWSKAVDRGWVDHSSARTVRCLTETAGARWLVTAILHELLKLRYEDILERGTDIALAIFHVNIKNCAIELLTHVLPQLLYNSMQTDNLMEPQLSALARLTSYCVYAALDEPSVPPLDDATPAKKPRVVSDIISALKGLLGTFEAYMSDGSITQQTYFTFHLLQCLSDVRTAPTNRIVLGAVSSSLISELLRTLPDMFTPALLVKLHDLQTIQGRANMARDLCVERNFQLRHINNCFISSNTS